MCGLLLTSTGMPDTGGGLGSLCGDSQSDDRLLKCELALALPIGVKVVISKEIAPCPKEIKMTDEAVSSGSAKYLQPPVNTIND